MEPTCIHTWCGDRGDLAAHVEEEENLSPREDVVGGPLERVLAALVGVDCHRHQLLLLLLILPTIRPLRLHRAACSPPHRGRPRILGRIRGSPGTLFVLVGNLELGFSRRELGARA